MQDKDKKHFPGHVCPTDPLEEIEDAQGVELPGPMHDKAEKPTKLPKKIRSGGKESYPPMHQR